MKRMMKLMIISAWLVSNVLSANAQKFDEERMRRDMEVAENVLSTLIRQKFDKRSVFPMEISGRYLPGYGVVFRVPSDAYSPWLITIDDDDVAPMVVGEPDHESYNFTYSSRTKERKGRAVEVTRDSTRIVFNDAMVEIAKEFLADYADLIGQLNASDKIIVTNRAQENSNWHFVNNQESSSLLSVEASKGNVTQLRQGKISREQFFDKLKVVNARTVEELEPDLELFSSIMQRLYREDLSKTYFVQDDLYYERLKDFGVIYYMHVYSSQPDRNQRHRMPTLRLENADQVTRDKKVKELYPQFEKEVRENMLEYGRTLKSLSEKENLILNVKITRCAGCEIPATLELTIDGASLKAYNEGRISKEAALGKVLVKQGEKQ
jgi:hypothetical protein